MWWCIDLCAEWASAKLLESANAIASAIVVIFMAVSLG